MSPAPDEPRREASRTWEYPSAYVLMGAVILLADFLSGPFLLFPILFVVPIALCGWFSSARLAYALAIVLPLGRLAIAALAEPPVPLAYLVINALIRTAVLVFLAFLIVRTARQTRELKKQVEGLVTMCAWSNTIRYQDEWISFAEYLRRQFGINTTHGISPAETEKILADIKSMSAGQRE